MLWYSHRESPLPLPWRNLDCPNACSADWKRMRFRKLVRWRAATLLVLCQGMAPAWGQTAARQPHELETQLAHDFNLATVKMAPNGAMEIRPGRVFHPLIDGVVGFSKPDLGLEDICPTSYRAGVLHEEKSVFCTTIPPRERKLFATSDAVCITAISVAEQKEAVSVYLVSCNERQGALVDQAYYGKLVFYFPGGVVSAANTARVEETLRLVLSSSEPEPGTATAGAPATSPAPASAPATKPANTAEANGPPADAARPAVPPPPPVASQQQQVPTAAAAVPAPAAPAPAGPQPPGQSEPAAPAATPAARTESTPPATAGPAATTGPKATEAASPPPAPAQEQQQQPAPAASPAQTPPGGDGTPAPAGPPAGKVKQGQTVDQVKAILGEPERVANLGSKLILMYPNHLKVTFVDGKVSQVEQAVANQ